MKRTFKGGVTDTPSITFLTKAGELEAYPISIFRWNIVLQGYVQRETSKISHCNVPYFKYNYAINVLPKEGVYVPRFIHS